MDSWMVIMSLQAPQDKPEGFHFNHFIALSPLEYSIFLSSLLRRSNTRRRRSKKMDVDDSEGHVCRLGSTPTPTRCHQQSLLCYKAVQHDLGPRWGPA